MEHYAGLDVSLRLTAVCVIDERGRVVSESKVASEPAAIADFLQPYADTLALAGLEAGLRPRICIAAWSNAACPPFVSKPGT